MLSVNELPYLTSDLPGIGGRIKCRPEDFIVEEVPLYEPTGEGTHLYVRIQKTGIPTMQAVKDVARALGRPARDVGYAGLKDADAVTTQTVSVEHVDPARIEALDLPRIRVLDVSRHTNKLKLGHLKGNRFTIRLRDVDPERVDDVRSALTTLARRGVPNYFGPQRFGMRGDTWQIGRAVLRQDFDEAVALMIGRVGPDDYADVRRARELVDRGDLAAAAEAWPYPFTNERRLCRALVKAKGDARRAFGAVDKQLKRFFTSAYQSHLFNQVVARRLDSLDRLLPGDLAWRHPQGAVFRVEEVVKEQPRCDAFEISPTGPLFGYRMTEPTDTPAEIEREVLAGENVTLDDFRAPGKHKVRGGRRPLRFCPHDATVNAVHDHVGVGMVIEFFLESGCYATTVLREICKAPLASAPTDNLHGEDNE